MAKQKAKENRKAQATEGRRLLREAEGSNAKIAKKLECSPGLVGHWRLGIRMPSDPYKEKLDLLFGIPRRSWDEKPNAKPKDPSTPPPDFVLTRPIFDEADDDDMVIATEQIEAIRLELGSTALTDSARGKLRDTLQKTLALRARLVRDRDLLEDRVVREHPEWVRIKVAILDVLKPYPEAARAIAEVLK